MTILAVCQNAAIKLSQGKMSQLFSSTEDFDVEIRAVANEAAKEICKSYDWRLLLSLETIAGDGTDTTFDLPDDFSRVVQNCRVYSTRSKAPLTPIEDVNRWLDLEISGIAGVPGYWMLLGGQINIKPALATGESAKYYYVHNEIVSDAQVSPTYKTEFTADSDVFRLSETLLEKEIIWRWRALKKMDYAEDMREAELERAREISSDRGRRILVSGSRRIPRDVSIAYPGTITP